MNQMIRRICNPNFRFPRDVGREFSESITREECSNENNVRSAFFGEALQFQKADGGNWTGAMNGFY